MHQSGVAIEVRWRKNSPAPAGWLARRPTQMRLTQPRKTTTVQQPNTRHSRSNATQSKRRATKHATERGRSSEPTNHHHPCPIISSNPWALTPTHPPIPPPRSTPQLDTRPRHAMPCPLPMPCLAPCYVCPVKPKPVPIPVRPVCSKDTETPR